MSVKPSGSRCVTLFDLYSLSLGLITEDKNTDNNGGMAQQGKRSPTLLKGIPKGSFKNVTLLTGTDQKSYKGRKIGKSVAIFHHKRSSFKQREKRQEL